MRFHVMIMALAVASTAAAMPAEPEAAASATIECCCCDIRVQKTVCTTVAEDEGCYCAAVVCPEQSTPLESQPVTEKA
ncbi:hypothetical protein AK830_g8780 [Neonectria ditissima]|uniref:Extracellular membrane protein CFEM domain-containing protein n=1 Tax=Neonectria ditissima TaxID=78410 RepID=A0A0P7AWJ4_9HYPO|nr:hypothetical protein AK830_g8780 [Neonectria ditissima]